MDYQSILYSFIFFINFSPQPTILPIPKTIKPFKSLAINIINLSASNNQKLSNAKAYNDIASPMFYKFASKVDAFVFDAKFSYFFE